MNKEYKNVLPDSLREQIHEHTVKRFNELCSDGYVWHSSYFVDDNTNKLIKVKG